jgi:hypothetical protein
MNDMAKSQGDRVNKQNKRQAIKLGKNGEESTLINEEDN